MPRTKIIFFDKLMKNIDVRWKSKFFAIIFGGRSLKTGRSNGKGQGIHVEITRIFWGFGLYMEGLD
jgi:hypothetical protein